MIKTIKSKVILLLSVFVGFMVITVGVTFYGVSQQTFDTSLVDISGRQRMLSQKVVGETLKLISALETEASNIGEIRESLTKTAALFDTSLNALRDGGTMAGFGGEELTLPASKGNTNLLLTKVTELWLPVKEQVSIVADPEVDEYSIEFAKATEAIKNSGLPILTECKLVVESIKKDSLGKIKTHKAIQLGSLVLMFVLATLVWFAAERHLLRRLSNLVDMFKGAEAEGDLTVRFDDQREDEIGDLSTSINQFLEKLQGIVVKVVSTTHSVSSASSELSETSA